MFELIINVLMFVFLGFTFFTHVIEAPIPAMVTRNPYALNPGVWPRVIIALLEICIAINVYQIIKRNKGKEDFTMRAFIASVPNFFKSRMFVGMVILLIASFILEPLGFMVTCFCVLFSYGLLLGDKKVVRLLITSVIITLVLYIIFSGMLSVNLPRGTVGFLRNFALALESLIGSIKGIFG